MDLNKMTIKEASEKLQSGDISSFDLTKACFSRIEELNSEYNVLLSICREEALAEAKEADKRLQKGEKGSLLGIPYIAKDNFLTKGIKTTAASKILENYKAPFDATIIKKLKKAGAVLLGKANMDEFAHGASGENSAFGATKNPWDKSRVAGGSSSGSAAAVALDMCLFSLGTDTGGSIRCPASFCNIVGIKPTYGRNSRFGIIAMTSSTDCPGALTKTVEDSAIVLKTIAGVDEHDATTVDCSVPDYRADIDDGVKGIKIGVPRKFFEELDPKIIAVIDKSIEKFKSMGAEVREIDLRYAKYGIPVYYIITPSEISSNLARFDGVRYGFSDTEAENLLSLYKNSRGKGFGPEVKRRIMLGTYALSAGYYDAYYLQAQKVRTKIKEELDSVLEDIDLILMPTQPDIAFKIGEQSDDPLKMYLEDMFSSPASLSGLPAISIPADFSDGMPVGLQLVAKQFKEAVIYRAARAFEKKSEAVGKRVGDCNK